MNKATEKLLSADEVELVRATAERRLARLDEDTLLELHDRVRRARNKYAKLHRRQAARQVDTEASRGAAATKNARTAEKAEVFEEALERVSTELAAAAAAAAARLREERLARVRTRHQGGGGRTAGGGKVAGQQNRRAATSSPREVKIAAAGRAAGKRRQASRDSRR